MLAIGAFGSFVIANELGDPSSKLWLDNGQPVAFMLSGSLSLALACQPTHRRLSIAAGTLSLGAVSWRLATAIIEVVRYGASSDWLRVGNYVLMLSVSWIAWSTIWLIVGIAERVHNEGLR